MRFEKRPLPISDQVKLLVKRGLQVPDLMDADAFLSNVSYFRLRPYLRSFRDGSQTNKSFLANTSLLNVKELYQFDCDLRLIVFDIIGRIEVAIRAQMINEFSLTYGSHWYRNHSLFKNIRLWEKDLNSLDKELIRSSEPFINSYRRKYSIPSHPPSWMSLEIMTLGLLSKMFQNLKNCCAKRNIVNHFGLKHPRILENWLHALTDTRNICAHHGRLWNRQFNQSLIIPRETTDLFLNNKAVNPNRVYVLLSCMIFLIRRTNTNTQFVDQLSIQFDRFKNSQLDEMGFPQNWREEQLWN